MNSKVFKKHNKITSPALDQTYSLNCFCSMTTSELENQQFYIYNSSETFEIDVFSYYEIKQQTITNEGKQLLML